MPKVYCPEGQDKPRWDILPWGKVCSETRFVVCAFFLNIDGTE